MAGKTAGSPKTRPTASRIRAASPSATPVATVAPTAPAAPVRSGGISEDDRRHMIAEAAYYKAERRGFRHDAIDQNWLDAEAEIDALLARQD